MTSTVGEFARIKMQELLKRFENKEKINDQEAKQFIDTIGDNYIRKTLNRLRLEYLHKKGTVEMLKLYTEDFFNNKDNVRTTFEKDYKGMIETCKKHLSTLTTLSSIPNFPTDFYSLLLTPPGKIAEFYTHYNKHQNFKKIVDTNFKKKSSIPLTWLLPRANSFWLWNTQPLRTKPSYAFQPSI